MLDEYFADKALIGVACSFLPSRFCWLLEAHFGIELFLDAGRTIVLSYPNQSIQSFNVYRQVAPLHGVRHKIYVLRNETHSLLPDAKTLDYVWQIQCPNTAELAEQYAGLLRSLPSIQLATLIAPQEFKSVSNLIE